MIKVELEFLYNDFDRVLYIENLPTYPQIGDSMYITLDNLTYDVLITNRTFLVKEGIIIKLKGIIK